MKARAVLIATAVAAITALTTAAQAFAPMAMDRDGSASGVMHPRKVTTAPHFPGPLFAGHRYRHRWYSHGRSHYR